MRSAAKYAPKNTRVKAAKKKSCCCVACIIVGASIGGLLLVGILGFLVWAYTPAGLTPNAEVLAALQSTPDVTVTKHSGFYTFEPAANDNKIAYIFYPGGHVDYRSYAPVLKEIARGGVYVAALQVSECLHPNPNPTPTPISNTATNPNPNPNANPIANPNPYPGPEPEPR